MKPSLYTDGGEDTVHSEEKEDHSGAAWSVVSS